jgi:hypothetical protein
MDLQPQDSGGLRGREPHHIREVGIQGHQDAAGLDSEAEDLWVGRSRKTDLCDGDSVVPLGPQVSSMHWREVFVQEELH